MGISLRQRGARWVGAAAVTVMLAFPATVAATITGGCTATGHAASTGDIDLTTETDWHVKSTDTLSGDGQSTEVMRSGSLSAYALGIAIPIVPEKTGNGDTVGSVDGISMEAFSKLGKVFVIAGKASGDGACDGQILIVVDDVDAWFTVLGGGGLAVFIIGLAAVLMASRSSGCVPRALGMFFGALGAAGLGLSLEQFQVISPTSPIGLAILIVGAILGFILGGGMPFFGPDNEVTPVTVSTAPAAPPAAPAPTPATPPSTSEAQAFINDVAAPAAAAPASTPATPAAPRAPESARERAAREAWEADKFMSDTGVIPDPPDDPSDLFAPASPDATTPGVDVNGAGAEAPAPGQPGAGDGQSHTIPSDPENPPVGGGSPA